jgi:hypothetical protein
MNFATRLMRRRTELMFQVVTVSGMAAQNFARRNGALHRATSTSRMPRMQGATGVIRGFA